MLQSISSLKSAVIALSKHHDASAFLQGANESKLPWIKDVINATKANFSATKKDKNDTNFPWGKDLYNATMRDNKSESAQSTTELLQAGVTIQFQLRKHSDLFRELITPHQRKLVESFAQSPEDYFGAQSGFLQEKQSYAPASGEIFGILKQMKESFETNLGASQSEEMENQKAYEDLKAAKEAEIAAGQSQIDTKSTELGNTDLKNAQSKENLENTQEVLAADTAFLADLKERCANMDSEYEERTKTRQLEIQAVSKALAFLSSDEAHDLFTRTFNFVQVQSTISSSRRAKISAHLELAAQKSRDPRISTLATQAR